MDLRVHAECCIADTEITLGDAREWMEIFIHANTQKNEVIKALIKRLEDDQHKIGQLRRDLAAEHKSRNNFQVEAERYESSVQRLQQKINEGSFISVLIDGDGAKFEDSFLQNPIEGAPRAAQALKQAVRDHIQKEFPELDSDDIPILIRIYSNLNGLANSLRLSRIIEKEDDMKEFAEQLTNTRTDVDFVNVGRGKENADSKIRKMLNHHHKNLQCKKVFVACCHDNGYLHDLREYADKHELHKKIILVETTPAEPLFQTLGFPITRFDTVFRSKPLDNQTKHSSVLPSRPTQQTDFTTAPFVTMRQPSITRAQVDGIVSRVTGSGSLNQQQQLSSLRVAQTPVKAESQLSSAAAQVEIGAVSRTPTIVDSGNGGTSISYAAAGGGPGELQNITLKSTKIKKPIKTILYNRDGCRIDPPTKNPGQSSAQPTYQTKLKKAYPNVFCNEYYLVGSCKKMGCERIHNVDLTPQEVSIHRYKARTSVCPRGPECGDYDCYLSHHCLRDPQCTRGTACKFTNTEHGNQHLDSSEKLQPATRWTEGCDFPDRHRCFREV